MMTLTNSCHSAFTESSDTQVSPQEEIIKLVSKNDIKGVKNALENNTDVNSKDANKRSLLLIATNNGHIEMAKLLVKYGADVNLQADNMDSPFYMRVQADRQNLSNYSWITGLVLIYLIDITAQL